MLDAIKPDAEPILKEKKKPYCGLQAKDINLASLKTVLQQRQEKLRKTVLENEEALTAAKADLNRGKQVIQESRKELPSLAETFSFYTELKEYTHDVIACFNEKVGDLNFV